MNPPSECDLPLLGVRLLLILLISDACSSLKMLGINGLSSVNKGDVVSLTCLYDLERDAIYSMKWYKDGSEVYRYVPTEEPEYKAFDVPGIRIDNSSTRPNMLVARVLNPLASGVYKCEITVETPSFVTLEEAHTLTVVVPPRLGPQITGIANFYNPGDLVEITCTSKDSNPAPNLTWRLNGKRVPEGFQLPYEKLLNETTGLESAHKGLRFTAKDDHFPNGELRMECNAEIEGVWTAHIAGVALGGASGRASDRHPSEIRARDMENQGPPGSCASLSVLLLILATTNLVTMTPNVLVS